MEQQKPIEDRKRAFAEQEQRLKRSMKQNKHTIAVISGKDRVGKNKVALNLAMAFTAHGYVDRVDILDIDSHGPCIPKLLEVKGRLASGRRTLTSSVNSRKGMRGRRLASAHHSIV